MKRFLSVLLPLVLCAGFAAPVGADINFFSYQKTLVPAYEDTARVYYDTQFNMVQLGTSRLDRSEISVVPRGSYLDIVEDAWISGNLTDLSEPNLISSFLFQGLVTLPPRATVVGLETWKGDTMFRAKLHQTQYSYTGSFPDSLSLERILDSRIASMRQVTETTYEVLFSRVSIGESKHVRVRYLLPNEGNGNSPFSIPVLFNPAFTAPPSFIRLTVFANSTDESFYLATQASPIQLHDSSSLMIPYESSIALTYAPKALSALYLTTFTAGTWQGNYVLLNTALTDSTLQKLSKPIQTVFIWRWNAPQQIVTFNGQIKGLSAYAYSIINQAKSMSQTITMLQKRGYRCGLVHSIEGSKGLAYQTLSINDASSSSIISYLGTFTENALYSAYLNQGSPVPSWVPASGSSTSVINLAQHDFLSQLRSATGLLGDTSVAYRHVVLVTVGDATTSYAENYRSTTDSILVHTTIDATNAQWRGVDIGASLPSIWDQSLAQWGSYYFPAFSPLTVQLRIQTSDQPYSFPLTSASAGNFSITARTTAVWDTLFTWIGFDQNGKVTSTLTTKPVIFREPLDSGAAKIWAHDPDHLAQVEETYPGGTFGVVTKSTFLQATVQDISSDTSSSVPFLADFEILAPRSLSARQVKPASVNAFKASFRDGILTLTNAGDLRRLDVFDLSGKLLASVDLRACRVASGTYRVALRSLIRMAAHRVFLVRISGPSFLRTLKLTPGGIL